MYKLGLGYTNIYILPKVINNKLVPIIRVKQMISAKKDASSLAILYVVINLSQVFWFHVCGVYI